MHGVDQCFFLFSPKNIFATSLMLSFSHKVEAHKALADVQLLTSLPVWTPMHTSLK
jgi:hypothetical protein